MTLAAFGEGFHPLRVIHVAALNQPAKLISINPQGAPAPKLMETYHDPQHTDFRPVRYLLSASRGCGC